MCRLAHKVKIFKHQSLKLVIRIDLAFDIRWKIKLKLRVGHELEYFIDIEFLVGVVELKAYFEVLEVENSDVGLRIIFEALDDPGVVNQVLFEELRDGVGLRENVEFPLLFEVAEWPSRVHDLF